MKKYFLIPSIALAISLASCGGENTQNDTDNAASTEETTSTDDVVLETVEGIENVTLSNTWTVEANDNMKFNTELIRVSAGEPVEITLKNVGTLAKESMGHNFVILKPGVDMATFGGEAAAAADNEYIPKSSLSSIVDHTKLLGPSEEDKITVTLEKGVYDFICSFPGHFGMMKGKIVAE